MKTLRMALWATGALVTALPAMAAEPDWTYGQVGYMRADSGDDATDGWGLKGSLGFAEMWHAQLEYLDGQIGIDSGPDQDFDGYRVRFGANPSVSDDTDAVIAVQYFDISYDEVVGGADVDADGFGIGVGLRSVMADKVEVNAMAWWNEGNTDSDTGFDEDFSDVSLEIGGRYRFTEALSGGVTFEINNKIVDPLGSGSDSVMMDLRYSFADLM